MSKKWSPYVVQQGDHTEKLAFLRGATADEVWSYSGNAALSKKRRSMSQLLPGDVVQLPELPPRGLTIRSGSTNSYVATVPTVTVSLSFQDTKGPFANTLYHVEGLPLRDGERPESGKTGPRGDVTLKVPVTTREFTVVLPQHHLEHHILLGDLDPHNEPSGIVQRLQNLGFLARDTTPSDLAPVVRAFQKSVGLPPTGTVDEATSSRLDAAAAAQVQHS